MLNYIFKEDPQAKIIMEVKTMVLATEIREGMALRIEGTIFKVIEAKVHAGR